MFIPKKKPLQFECISCGKIYVPLTPNHKQCFGCYKKQAKPLVIPKVKEIDKSVKDTQKMLSRPLDDEEKATVAYMLARFVSINDIRETFAHDYGKIINYESIKSIRESKKWSPVIDKYRNEWLTKISEVPIANKRVRMEAYQDMLEEAIKVKNYSIVRHALQGAQGELEKIEKNIGNNYSLTYINSIPDADLNRRKEELLSKIKYLTKSIHDNTDDGTIEVNTDFIKESEDKPCPIQSEETQL